MKGPCRRVPREGPAEGFRGRLSAESFPVKNAQNISPPAVLPRRPFYRANSFAPCFSTGLYTAPPAQYAVSFVQSSFRAISPDAAFSMSFSPTFHGKGGSDLRKRNGYVGVLVLQVEQGGVHASVLFIPAGPYGVVLRPLYLNAVMAVLQKEKAPPCWSEGTGSSHPASSAPRPPSEGNGRCTRGSSSSPAPPS